MGAPISYTCSSIDEFQKNIEGIINSLNHVDCTTGADLDLLSDAISELKSLRVEAEDLRTSNSKLRDYGENMESEKDEYKEKVENLEYEVDNLKDQIKSLEKQLSELESQL